MTFQIVTEQSSMLLLCGYIVTIISLFQGSTAEDCLSTLAKCSSLREDVLELPSSLSSCSLNHSEACISVITSNIFYFTRPRFSYGLASVYILIDLAPLMVYLPLLILFNVNLVAGPAQSFAFFYQALPAIFPLRINPITGPVNVLTIGHIAWGLPIMQSPINDLIFPLTLPYIALQYCKLAVVLLVAVTTVVLVKCIGCPCASWRQPWAKLRRSVRHFREKRALKGTVLNGLCSIAILTYSFVIQQLFTIIQPTSRCCPNNVRYCAYLCTELERFRGCHLQFYIPAVFSVVLVLPLPVFLLYFPAVPALVKCIIKRSCPVTCHKLAPVFDVFQSAYKPKFRFFAALTLLYRFAIWLPMAIVLSRVVRFYIIIFVFILILAIHSLVQPYSKPIHNYIETLYLVNLVIISMIAQATAATPTIGAVQLVLVEFILTVLIYLPIVIGAVNICWARNCCKRCKAACRQRVKRKRKQSLEEEDKQVLPSEVYLEMSEVEQVNQN